MAGLNKFGTLLVLLSVPSISYCKTNKKQNKKKSIYIYAVFPMANAMVDSSYRLNFDQGKKNEIQHQS